MDDVLIHGRWGQSDEVAMRLQDPCQLHQHSLQGKVSTGATLQASTGIAKVPLYCCAPSMKSSEHVAWLTASCPANKVKSHSSIAGLV